jgi:hypothetical protein
MSIPFGMSARNFLRSDVFPTLKKHARLIIITPLGKNPEFLKEFSSPDTVILSIPHRRSLFRSLVVFLFSPIQSYHFTKRTQLTTLIDLKNLLKKSKPLRYWTYVLLGETLGRFDGVREGLRRLYFRAIDNPELAAVLDRYSVDLVFTTHGLIQLDIELALQARKRNIPVVNMVHSWDNLTSKSGLRQVTNNEVGAVLPAHLYDRFIVWNSVLRDELKTIYHVPEEKIHVAGIPQFDAYPGIQRTSSREAFFRSHGMDPAKKLIFFVTTHPDIIHGQTEIVKGLVAALRAGRFGNSQLLIRTHPGAAMTEWHDLLRGPDVFFQKPTSSFTPREITSWEKDADNPMALAEAIHHSDVMIQGVSTTAIEAAALDKPCICLGYHGNSDENVLLLRSSHYAKLLQLGGMKVARSESDLFDHINAYLAHPDLDKDGRAKTRREYCTQLDEQSGKRIADILLGIIGIKTLGRQGIEP